MTDTRADSAWIEEASTRALEFLAVLAADGPEAATERPRIFDELMEKLDDPPKLHTMLYTMVWIAHCMRTSAAGDNEPGVWTFEIHTPFGRTPIDQAPPAIRWVSRWLIACMNDDITAAADLWFGTPASQEEAEECTKALTGPLLTFLSHSVREFLEAGRPLVIPASDESRPS